MSKKKILFIAAANNFHFIRDIVVAMQSDFEIDYFDTNSPVLYLLDLYDIVWLEWFDGGISQILKIKLSTSTTKYIVRLHRYELFTPRTLVLIQKITDSGAYKNIDKLIFVSEFVRQIGISKFPWMENSVVIPNLIDHTKFPFHDRPKGYNLLFLGRISYVKNLPIMLDYFKELVSIDLKYRLHIVGDIAEPELRYYVRNYMNLFELDNFINFYGQIDHGKLPKLMRNMNYIICTSIFESQGMGIIEAMASGLKPVIYNFLGAEQFYPDEWLFKDRSEFVKLIMSENNPQEYHEYAVKHFSIERNIQRYKDLLLNL